MTIPDDDPRERAVVTFRAPSRLLTVLDVSLGAGAAAATAAGRALGAAGFVARPFVGLALRPPLLDRALWPETVLGRIARRGGAIRVAAGSDLEAVSRALVPAVTDAVVDRIDLTELVLTRVDLVRIVEAVLDGIDLTALVLDRVDLDRVVAGADLDAAAARLDVDAVAARMDLVGIADYIVDAIDLSEIIRTSTGSVATEAVRGVRMQSIDADAQVQKVVDRVLLRRKARRTQAPAPRPGGPA